MQNKTIRSNASQQAEGPSGVILIILFVRSTTLSPVLGVVRSFIPHNQARITPTKIGNLVDYVTVVLYVPNQWDGVIRTADPRMRIHSLDVHGLSARIWTKSRPFSQLTRRTER